MTHLPAILPVTLLIGALLSLLAGLWRPRAGHFVAVAASAVAAAAALLGVAAVLRHGEIRYAMGSWPPPLGIEYVLDTLSAYLIAIITVIGLLVMIYAGRSLTLEVPRRKVFVSPAMLMLLAGLVGMTVTADAFNLYVFLEIASLAAYALLSVGDRPAPLAALRYLIIGSVAGSFYLLGVGFLYFATGTLNMADLAARLPELYHTRAVIAGAVLIIAGLGLKMALFPLHLWLPDVYTFGASSVTGLIAPLMTKVAAYALIRLVIGVFSPAFFTETLPFAPVIAWMAAGGIVFGSAMAVAQTDVRRMLAYSSVSQIAFIALGLGLANKLALIGGLLHILNHAVMKACLFLAVGGVRARTGLVDVRRWRGLGWRAPWTMAAFTVAALAMIGVPPTAGFFSKWYLLLGSVAAGAWVFVVVIVASSVLTAIYFFKVIELVYDDPPGKDKGEQAPGPEPEVLAAGDPPASMLLPILALAVLVLLAGVFNAWIVTHLLEPAVRPLAS